ncbi:hypothetical protein EVAR_37_1 [Eumeta japonica]|uniref:Uncharacterized protein n=1 Tax=Eumeta variegata TaxID=151549 RepID=A0A4C1S7Z1_EUMVA|nr:hypothetical protein EVAR_37_1 [Eumeta japonica]
MDTQTGRRTDGRTRLRNPKNVKYHSALRTWVQKPLFFCPGGPMTLRHVSVNFAYDVRTSTSGAWGAYKAVVLPRSTNRVIYFGFVIFTLHSKCGRRNPTTNAKSSGPWRPSGRVSRNTRVRISWIVTDDTATPALFVRCLCIARIFCPDCVPGPVTDFYKKKLRDFSSGQLAWHRRRVAPKVKT